MQTEKQKQIAQVHPYLQAQMELAISPLTGTFKFRLGEEVRHIKSGGVYIICGLPNEIVLEETRKPAYAYLMPDGRTCIRAQEFVEDGRFESAPEGSSIEWFSAGTNLADWLEKSNEPAECEPEVPLTSVAEAIAFDEFIEYGKQHCKVLTNGMPWSFEYKGHQVTHENDDCYIIPTANGSMMFKRGALLVTRHSGRLFVCDVDMFPTMFVVRQA